jgi:plastocyanin
MRRISRVLAVLTVAAAMAFPALPAAAARYRVTVSGNRWTPARRSIAKGDVVVWKNNSSRPHNVVAYGGNWRKNAFLSPGRATRARFGKRGSYKYRCTLHSSLTRRRCRGMCGSIQVAL